MNANRLEAFSDAVIAIIITIMVLELHPPEGHSFNEWESVLPKLIAYIFSFLVLAIYWNNHHHLLKATKDVSSSIMWNNMHLLFWLSLIPVATAWVGEHGNYLHSHPVMFYSFIGSMSGLAYYLLARSIVKNNPKNPAVQGIIKDKKGLISLAAYSIALIASLKFPVVSLVCIWLTAVVWFIPDTRLTSSDK